MRKSSPRKVRDPMAYIHTHITLAQDQQRDIGIAYRSSLQAMLRGHGTEQTWSTVACMLNLALMLSEQGVLPKALDTIKQAQQAIVRSRARAMKFGAWAFDGEGIRDVLAAANYHDEQLEVAKRSQVVHAIKEVHRRVEIGEAI
jgi:hypothetical protein